MTGSERESRETSRKRNHSWWKGLPLTTDYLMSGNFLSLFFFVFLATTILFFLLWGITAYFSNWNPGEAFLQLTNPTRHLDPPYVDPGAQEWVAIVCMNLFGLFFINGIVLTIFVNWVSNRKDRHLRGEARYPYIQKKRFSVIIGGHKMAAGLAHSLIRKKDIEYVLIQTQRNPEALRKEIMAEINDEKLAKNVVIYSGDRTSWHELAELRLDNACEVYLIGEPFHIDGSSHDAINMQCWNEITGHLKEEREVRIPFHVMFEYQSTFSAFQFTDMKLEQSRMFRFIPFSMYETWAQHVLIGNGNESERDYIPLDGTEGIDRTSCQRVHLIVIGMSKMGMAMAIEAAHIAHYPNFNNEATGRPRTLITMIDRNAKREMLYFMGRSRQLFQLARWRFVKAPDGAVCPSDGSWDIYDTIEQIASHSNKTYPWHDPLADREYGSPYFGGHLGENLIDIDFEFIEGDVALPSIQKYISDACADNSARILSLDAGGEGRMRDASSKTTIAVCLPVAADAMSAALYFAPEVYEDVQQILVQQPESGALVKAIRHGLTGESTSLFGKLRAFGMTDRCDYLSRINSILPKLVAYAYNFCSKETLAEDFRKSGCMAAFVEKVEKNWLAISHDGGKSAISKRWSNLYCANSFDTKIRSMRIDISRGGELDDAEVVGELAKMEHNRWVMEQLLLGARPVDSRYARQIPIEDDDIRNKLKSRNIHPDLISNEKLGSTKKYDEGIARNIPLLISLASEIEKASFTD